MTQGFGCLLAWKDGEPVLQVYDAKSDSSVFEKDALFAELPEPIEGAIGNRELMAQLGENILIRLAVANGIQLGGN